MKQYDYLIVGAGLWGSVFAHEATKRGKKCLVIDRRPHIGGNTYCESTEGINVHVYGAHIFHTNDKEIWDYVNSFVEFNRYTNSPVANYKSELYNLPFNMNTFYQLWKVRTPEEAKAKIAEQVQEAGIKNPQNLEEQAISLVGTDMYEKLIKGYTEKQWGRKATELPAFIIKRLPVRFTYDNNYFNDRYQGIPMGGYNKLTEGLLKGSELRLNVDFFQHRQELSNLAETLVYTGKIDEYFDFQFGALEYRSLRFDHQVLDTDNYQGNAVVNYTDAETPYTRILEHKHFEFGTQPKTVVTHEYPQEWTPGAEPYYPINDEKNDSLFRRYKALAERENVIFGGRLAEYRYYDMHQVIGSALKRTRVHFGEE
ncbi:UDP-galactopyranose mutase [Rhabdobacter roseus]|uniref:UDP-galactopyranose mutase n=1 Tax=Rhabdobacter roseus TaxID=1655419 RepID=A0A840TQ03_9BACT|nr:UDP-galactopyranose mutase [Rhabdobacter roseus]MBB5284985.1 UDP-galactopyranose mutase [Rhabdobacter roseus]